jgi:hypothetical protein
MGYAFVTGICFGCGQPFGYHPYKVPSIRVNAQGQQDPNGTRQPVCQACVDRANPERMKNGLDPIEVLPGAYEPFEESELG